MIKGVISRISTLADGTIRCQIDSPQETGPDHIKSWLYEEVIITKKETPPNGKQKKNHD